MAVGKSIGELEETLALNGAEQMVVQDSEFSNKKVSVSTLMKKAKEASAPVLLSEEEYENLADKSNDRIYFTYED